MGSERSFGLVFAGAFAAVALYPALHGQPPRLWALGLAATLLALALVRPGLLAPLNRLWFRFGLALGKVMTPVAMALLFALAVVPTALVLKLLRKDPLRLRLDRSAATYWEPREQQPGSMSDQF
jgi:Saxitoxin biosynthesis operon protein SxtJ